MKSRFLFILLAIHAGVSQAQMVRPPAFAGGIPGRAQFQSMQMQRHQARTLLYREAIEELRKNPTAADVPECPASETAKDRLCLKTTPVAASPSAPTAPSAAAADNPSKTGRHLALLFGNNDYRKPIPELETPVADVAKVAEILNTRFGFETREVKNAGKAEIIEALNRIAADARPEDSVLLFYAGHGYLMDDTKMGFWIPVDGAVDTPTNWVSNTDISKLLSAIRARQLILVSDSCFSGSLTREQKVSRNNLPVKPDSMQQLRSVLVLSSGGEEPVSDEGKDGHSIFAWSLIKTLEAATGTTAGYEVWQHVHNRVNKEYPQEPQYGAVVSAGHMDGGDYLFRLR